MGKFQKKFAKVTEPRRLKNDKSLGQHWLRDRAILDEIAELSVPEADLDATDELPVCVEIGPGLGTLTSSLLRIYPKVVAVEFDERLATNLPKSFPGKNLEVLNADFLKIDLSQFPAGYVVCANIPYYITSPIITKLLEAENQPSRIVLLVQKEVAERVVAKRQTILSLLVQNLAQASLGPVVLREYFTPPPKVDSQVLILEPHAPLVSDEVFKVIRVGFSSPRKKVLKNLTAVYGNLSATFAKLGLSLDARPGDLSLQDWAEIQKSL